MRRYDDYETIINQKLIFGYAQASTYAPRLDFQRQGRWYKQTISSAQEYDTINFSLPGHSTCMKGTMTLHMIKVTSL